MKTFTNLFLDTQNRTQCAAYQSCTNPFITKMKLINRGTKVPAILNDKVKFYHNIDVQVTRSLEWVV